jgi:hypothetical protein
MPFIIAAAALLSLPLSAQALTYGGAAGSAGRTTFSVFPARALQGKEVTIGVATRAGATCQLSVRYAGGERQTGLPRMNAVGGRAVWRWTVPEAATAGTARVVTSCGRAGTATRTLLVVGSLIAPKITVVQKGFSIRTRPYGGSSVSYGLLLKNESPNADALRVNVMVNFVMPDDHLIGTDAHIVPVLPAGVTYAYGGILRFPAGAPVARLEVVIQVGDRQRRAKQQPALAGVRLLPSLGEPAWIGEVDGEVINDHPTLTLRNTTLSAVVFDAAGNIIGGGTGSAFATLPPGTRQIFKLTSGFDAIPSLNAASVQVSALGTYGPAGT